MGKREWAAVGLALCLFAAWFLSRPYLFVAAPDRLLTVVPAEAGLEFSTRFLHSVQKTPVEEFFTVDDARQGFILRRTRYQSFGVGLPFSAADGTFSGEDGFFLMDDMNRPFPRLELTKAPSMFDYSFEDISFAGYQHHPTIKAPVAV